MTTKEADERYKELKTAFQLNQITVEEFVTEYNDILRETEDWDGPTRPGRPKRHENI